ncbi:hypothetical protein GCM10009081_23230 [Brevundimonas nasdae]
MADRAGSFGSPIGGILGPIDIQCAALLIRHSGAKRGEEPGTQGHNRLAKGVRRQMHVSWVGCYAPPFGSGFVLWTPRNDGSRLNIDWT